MESAQQSFVDDVQHLAPSPLAHGNAHAHAVQFYDDEAFLTAVVTEFLGEGLAQGQPAVIIATSAHREAFLAKLRADGVDVAAARLSGRLVLLDARETLAQFMTGAQPDPERFASVIGPVIERSLAAGTSVEVRAYGEMVDLLWKDGNAQAALRLEDLWNDLATRYRFSLLCAYSMGNFHRAADSEQFRHICGQHTQVGPTEAYVRGDDAARLTEISQLQQRARALETEIVERALLEQRLRETVIALQEREADLEDVLENAAEGIHLVTRDGIIQWANAAELEMLGYTAAEFIDQPIAAFHVDQPVIDDMLSRLAKGETLREYEARMRHKDGSIRHVLVNSNVRWDEGEFVHTRCFSRDITALREASLEREQLLERERAARAEAEAARLEAERTRATAEHANRAKSEFLAIMSHELRTPLNAIGGYAELMELGVHGAISAPQREALDRIQRSQRMLLGLINQVLNYTRIETGNVHYELSFVPVDQTIRVTEALLLPQVQSKELRLEYRGCPRDVVVYADGEKLQQILLNLFANAVKFTDRGGEIAVLVECNDAEVFVRVADTGIGIPAEKLDVIFEPFVQIDANYTRTRDGVGLGLAISRDLARGMSGDLTVTSTPGSGSTFTLRLPRRAAH